MSLRYRKKSSYPFKKKNDSFWNHLFPSKTNLQSPDWLIIVLSMSLIFFGWVILYSASAFLAESRYGDQYFYLKRQILWSCLGALGFAVAFRINLQFLQKNARLLFILTICLLGLVLSVGHEVGGAKRWLRLGGIGLQPSEFAKISLIFLLADYLDRRRSRIQNFWSGFFPAVVLSSIIVFLIALERDLGTPILISIVAMGMIYLSGARYTHIFRMIWISLPILFFSVFMVPYRRDRLLAFLDPWQDSQGTGYQLVQSLLALGSGGVWGRGSGNSLIKMHYLPESQTDFVFPILGEEFGFMGTSSLTIIFFVLVFRCFCVAYKTTHWFYMLLVSGISLMIGGQVFINLGVVTGLLPTKGIPLPFISSGGSSIIVMLFCIGLVLNVSQQKGTPIISGNRHWS